LFVTTARRTGSWLAESLSVDGATKVSLEEAHGPVAGISRLRDEVFDAVLISHEPEALDALAFLQAVRAGGSEEPAIVLGTQSDQELSAACFEAGADAYVCVNVATSRTLNHLAERAVQRHQLLRHNRLLLQAERQRLEREHLEARHLLEELAGISRDLPPATSPAPGTEHADRPPPRLLDELHAHYLKLLRAHVIMGSGNLSAEVRALAELLVAAGVSPPQVLELHTSVTAESIAGLGNRSSRHVMTRSGLLALELMTHLAEGYRRRYSELRSPPRQTLLPGF